MTGCEGNRQKGTDAGWETTEAEVDRNRVEGKVVIQYFFLSASFNVRPRALFTEYTPIPVLNTELCFSMDLPMALIAVVSSDCNLYMK